MFVVTKSFIGRVKYGAKEDAGVYTWIAYGNDQYVMHSLVAKVAGMNKDHAEGEGEGKQRHPVESKPEAPAVAESGRQKPASATMQPFKQFDLLLN